MKVAKSFFFATALAALLGCEHHDGNSGNAMSSATDNNLAAQPQSDDSSMTIAMDSKAVIPSPDSVASVSTNQQLQENQTVWESSGAISYCGGYGLDPIMLIYELPGDESTNSIPTNSLTNAGSTNSLLT